MSNLVPRLPSPRAGPVILSILMGATGLAGCGGEAPPGAPSASNPSLTTPPITGAVCDDDTGDLSRSASERGGNLSAPRGIDLTHAEARVTDTTLQVSFLTAGPVADVPNPEFRMGQGPAGQVESFELVATPAAGAGGAAGTAAGPWELRLITFRPDARGGVQEAPQTVLKAPVKAVDNTLSYEVPLADLPRIATYIWQFGSSATSPDGQDTVIDDCDRIGPPSTVPPGSTAAPVTTSGALGDTLTYQTGSQVTVYAAEPAPAGAGTRNVAVDLKVCAPASSGVETRREFVSIATADDRSYPAKEVAAPREPGFPAVVVLDPGACRRGWVPVPVPDAAQPATVVYSPEASGAGALRWRVS